MFYKIKLLIEIYKIWKIKPKMSFCGFIQQAIGDELIFHVHDKVLIQKLKDYYLNKEKQNEI